MSRRLKLGLVTFGVVFVVVFVLQSVGFAALGVSDFGAQVLIIAVLAGALTWVVERILLAR